MTVTPGSEKHSTLGAARLALGVALVLALAAVALWQWGGAPGWPVPERVAVASAPQPPDYDRPNIVLVVFEDMSARVGAYGDQVARTPHFDRIAAEGVRYTRVFTTAGVCAPSRAALITGRYQQSIGAQHMRTHNPRPGFTGLGPAEYMAVPPPEVKAFPELLRAAGYYASNNGKTDYQFGEPFTVWDRSAPGADWRERPEGAPFFSMFNLLASHEAFLFPVDVAPDSERDRQIIEYVRRGLRGRERLTDPRQVKVPDWLPDIFAVRRDIARQYDNIHHADKQLGEIYRGLQAEGLLERTILIVTTDHGDGLPRAKRSLYDSGIHVPFVIRYPDGWGAGETRDELVSFVDLAPTILHWAGLRAPRWMQGRVFAGSAARGGRDYVFAGRDRTDEVPGRRRAVRDARFKYIRDFAPTAAPFFQPLAFRDRLSSMQALWQARANGNLPSATAWLFEPLPREQLYDLTRDRDEVDNLAADSAYNAHLLRLRAALDEWMARVGDLQALSEEAMIEKMWPGGVQPRTPAPEVRLSEEDGQSRRLIVAAPDGASVGFRFASDPPERWRLYTEPVALKAGQTVTVKAIRYGYAESSPVRVGY